MKICIKDSSGKKIILPIPFKLLVFGLDITPYIMNKISPNMSDEQREIIDCIDFKILAKNMRVLQNYKGLKLIEVTSKEGEEVSIII
ncbi:MAG: hypothetical protein H5T96_00290 [Tissierellales bacterium]|nr:hypothetical protein [Tissierellales bacterium]